MSKSKGLTEGPSSGGPYRAEVPLAPEQEEQMRELRSAVIGTGADIDNVITWMRNNPEEVRMRVKLHLECVLREKSPAYLLQRDIADAMTVGVNSISFLDYALEHDGEPPVYKGRLNFQQLAMLWESGQIELVAADSGEHAWLKYGNIHICYETTDGYRFVGCINEGKELWFSYPDGCEKNPFRPGKA